MLRIAGCFLLAVPLCAFAPRALAQQAAQPSADESRSQEARALFDAGSTALDAGRFADALGYFERAEGLSHHPAFLYNIGIAASELGQFDRAIAAFQQFLREEPDTDHRQDVEGRLHLLEIARNRQQSGPGPVAPVVPAESHGPGVAPWIVIGASGAAVIGGAVLFAVGLGANSTVESSVDWPSVSADYDRGKLFTTLGAIIGAVGLAGAAAGVVWLVAGSGEPGEASVHASAGLGGVSIGGTF